MCARAVCVDDSSSAGGSLPIILPISSLQHTTTTTTTTEIEREPASASNPGLRSYALSGSTRRLQQLRPPNTRVSDRPTDGRIGRGAALSVCRWDDRDRGDLLIRAVTREFPVAIFTE